MSVTIFCIFQSISYRFQSSTKNPGSNRPEGSVPDQLNENESFLNNRDAMQAIADEEAIDSVEQATSSRVEMISQAMKNYLLKSREKRL